MTPAAVRSADDRGPTERLSVPIEHLLTLTGVSKTYQTRKGRVDALTGTSASIAPGEFVSIVGPSGCGKSTLLRLVAGLDSPTSGAIQILDEEVRGPSRRTGVVFQEALLLPWRTALDNVLLPTEVERSQHGSRAANRRRAGDLLSLVGLDGFHDALPRELSGGMAQRVALARALMLDPSVLLMDEPFGALDAITREQMNMELMRIWAESHKTVIFITHSVPEAVLLADTVLVMAPSPGRVSGSVAIDLARPRSLHQLETPEGAQAMSQVREVLEAA